ncbi:MAG: dicarboxylate/amino acid:cation symporter [Legionellales bacterium]|jgi:Na+/H+-dicarboxylate symporter|nr:dicarboxylate/amino acid:cation symporter [Legionellales bacterium]
MDNNLKSGFTANIVISMFCAVVLGFVISTLPADDFLRWFFVDEVCVLAGKIFIILLKMLVVPIVFVSLVCGVANMTDAKKLGSISIISFTLYLLTTVAAISLALFVASSLGIGTNVGLIAAGDFAIPVAPPLADVILNLFPANPFRALVNGEMLQVIIFAIIFGVAVLASGKAGQRVAKNFQDLNDVIVNLVLMIMNLAPIGVFCLLTVLVVKSGFGVMSGLLGYFLTVLGVLMLQLLVVYSVMLILFARRSPYWFLKNMSSAMLFAFSVSSSSASIPVVMQTAKNKLKLNESVVSFVIPLGATINMDGTAIMQGVATVFIANAYGLDIAMSGYITIVLMATLASIGTAGVPGVGLITLAMVLAQVGLPVEGIAMIIGVDRLLDMTRTAVNVAGDCAVACVVDRFARLSPQLESDS